MCDAFVLVWFCPHINNTCLASLKSIRMQRSLRDQENLNGNYYSGFPLVAPVLSHFSSETGRGETHRLLKCHAKGGESMTFDARRKGGATRKKGKNFFRQGFSSSSKQNFQTKRANIVASDSERMLR